MPGKNIHLVIEEGPSKGQEIVVPPAGVRIGRSSNNDIVVKDPALSRFHCRIFFKPNEGLWALDLGSANQTTLNGVPLTESRVKPGDRIQLGVTTIKVVSDLPAGEAPKDLFRQSDPPARQEQAPGRSPDRPRSPLRGGLIMATAIMGVLVLAIFVYPLVFPKNNAPGPAPLQPTDSEAAGGGLEIAYEKVEAGPENVFRYAMDLRDGKLSIQIDDLRNNRHVPGTQAQQVDERLINELAERIRESDFFRMKEEHTGHAPDVLDSMTMTVTIGRKTRTVRVVNCLEPREFRQVREMVEEFGQNELGLASIALSPEKLRDMAREAHLLGRNLYDQRDVKYENLYKAIRALKEAVWYMETIEPKPDFYAETVALKDECEEMLAENFKTRQFQAERAIKLQDWVEAAKHLRAINDMIPDRADERNQYARKKLVDVERRIRK